LRTRRTCRIVAVALLTAACSSGAEPQPEKPIRSADERCVSEQPADHFYAENIAYVDADVIDLPGKADGSGADERSLERASAELARTTGAMSFLVMVNGKLVWERYFNGSKATHANNVHSASKAILSLALGRAIAAGELELDDDIRDHLPARLVPDGAPDLTVRDLASMSGALAWRENETEFDLDQEASYVRQILELEQTGEPGKAFAYNTGLTQLLSAVIAEATGTSLCEYAQREVLDPIGVTVDHWHTDPDGYDAGGHSVFITPRELARIGQVVLDESDNRLDGGPPGSWIKKSLARTWHLGCRAPSESLGYGLLWWRSNINDVKVWKAEGFGGQSMFIIPATQTVVVITSDTYTTHTDPVDQTVLVTNLVLDFPGGGGCEGFDVRRMDVDGIGGLDLTFSAATDLWGAPSPDGEQMAFQSTRDGNWEIYVTDADRSVELAGKDPRRLTTDTRMDTFPAWSPDGDRIAFSRGGEGGGIFTMDVDGRNVRRVTDRRDVTPAWSPDGERIAFGRASDERSEPDTLMVVDAEGGDARRLGDLHGAAPAWSSDGRRVTFFRDDTVYTANADGTSVREVAEGRHPRFLPDGSLVFGARGGRDGTWRIARWDDGDVTTVVDTIEDDLVPMPSHDGTWLTYASAPKSARGAAGASQ
jgi:Tol biopolymer transport system component/CubicO group peptidase (beta-lactamase class C family)